LHHFRDIIDYFPKFKESRDRDHSHLRNYFLNLKVSTSHCKTSILNLKSVA